MQGLQVGSVECTSKNVLPDKERGFSLKVVFLSYKENTVRLDVVLCSLFANLTQSLSNCLCPNVHVTQLKEETPQNPQIAARMP
jgi:hypothetical protein